MYTYSYDLLLVQQKPTQHLSSRKKNERNGIPICAHCLSLNPGNHSVCFLSVQLSMFSRLRKSVLHLTPGYYSTLLLLLFSTKASWLGHRAGSRANSGHGLTLPVFLGMRALPEPLTVPWQLYLTNAAVADPTHRSQPAVPHQSRRALCGQPARTSSVPRACQGAAGKEARVRICPAPLPSTLSSSDLQGPKVGWTHEEPRPQRLRSLPTGIQQAPMGWARGWQPAPLRGHSLAGWSLS